MEKFKTPQITSMETADTQTDSVRFTFPGSSGAFFQSTAQNKIAATAATAISTICHQVRYVVRSVAAYFTRRRSAAVNGVVRNTRRTLLAIAIVRPVTTSTTARNTFRLVKKTSKNGVRNNRLFSKNTSGVCKANPIAPISDFRFNISVTTFSKIAVATKIPSIFHSRFITLSSVPFYICPVSITVLFILAYSARNLHSIFL